MISQTALLLSAAVLGIPAALAPGPLLTLLISETLLHGKTRGSKIAFVPLISDLPIVILAYFVVSRFQSFDVALGVIAIIGALYVGYLSYGLFKLKLKDLVSKAIHPMPFRKLVSVNLMNPNIYMFWFTVGAPLSVGNGFGWYGGVMFVLIFYIVMVGAKLLVVYTVNWFNVFLTGARYIFTMRVLGAFLLFFALYFLKDGLQYLGVL